MWDIWQEIYGTIRRNKMRTALTGFSVAWGIFMLIVLLGAGNGLIHAFDASVAGQAMNSISFYPGWASKPYDGLNGGRRIRFDNRDLDVTRSQFPEHIIQAGAWLYQGNVNISFGQEYINQSLLGVSPLNADLQGIKIAKGRFINEMDLASRRKSIVLEQPSCDILFGKSGIDPIGQFVNAGGVAYQVVGIVEERDDRSERDAYIPFSTLQTIYNRGNELYGLNFTIRGLDTEEANAAFEKEYRKALSVNHRFDPEDSGAIWIWNRFTQYMSTQKASRIIRIALWVIGILTLLGGIVGVSNIMLITVKERTREFGIRKALGAKPRSILGLIILESVTITTLFGYIGLVAGIAVTEAMDKLFGNQTMDNGMGSATIFTDPTIDISIAVQALVVMIVAGTLAGFFPARKAVNIRPIEALRAD